MNIVSEYRFKKRLEEYRKGIEDGDTIANWSNFLLKEIDRGRHVNVAKIFQVLLDNERYSTLRYVVDNFGKECNDAESRQELLCRVFLCNSDNNHCCLLASLIKKGLQYDLVEFVLSKIGKLISLDVWPECWELIDYAIKNEDKKMIRYLLENYPSISEGIDEETNRNCLWRAIEANVKPDVVEAIFFAFPALVVMKDVNDVSPLLLVARKKDFRLLSSFLQHDRGIFCTPELCNENSIDMQTRQFISSYRYADSFHSSRSAYYDINLSPLERFLKSSNDTPPSKSLAGHRSVSASFSSSAPTTPRQHYHYSGSETNQAALKLRELLDKYESRRKMEKLEKEAEENRRKENEYRESLKLLSKQVEKEKTQQQQRNRSKSFSSIPKLLRSSSSSLSKEIFLQSPRSRPNSARGPHQHHHDHSSFDTAREEEETTANISSSSRLQRSNSLSDTNNQRKKSVHDLMRQSKNELMTYIRQNSTSSLPSIVNESSSSLKMLTRTRSLSFSSNKLVQSFGSKLKMLKRSSSGSKSNTSDTDFLTTDEDGVKFTLVED